MLDLGTKIPDFEAYDQKGNLIKSSDLIGSKFILYFYPKDNTPGCTQEACGYNEQRPHFLESGVEVYGVSKDSIESHKKFANKYNLDFTLLSDPDLVMIQAFDCWHQKNLYGKLTMGVVRTTYLIDENGIILYACDKVKAKEDALKMLGMVEI